MIEFQNETIEDKMFFQQIQIGNLYTHNFIKLKLPEL